MYNPYENNNQSTNDAPASQNNGYDDSQGDANTEKKVSSENASDKPLDNVASADVNDSAVSSEYHMTGDEIPSSDAAEAEKSDSVPTQSNYQGYNNTYGSANTYGAGQQPNYQQSQNGYYNNNYYGQTPQQGNSSYTWNQQPNYQHPNQHNAFQQPKPPKPPKQKKPKKPGSVSIGAKIAAILLCCLVSSGASIGVFAALINTGVIDVKSNGSGSSAFTITKIVNDSSSGDTQTSNDVTGTLTRQEIANKVIPSVVCIQNYQVTQQNSYFGATTSTDDSEVSPAGEGSGIIISEDGYIVTNAHVVADATSLKVITSDGTSYEATLVGSDEVTDIAVIKIEATGLQKAEFGSAEDLQVADEVVAIGNPGGYEFNSSVTVGYVSALNREITNGDTGYTMYCIQTDAAINPGNSGGPLVNQYGQVVGINSSKIVAEGYEGLGFAIPSDTVQPIVSDLMNYGYVKDRAVLGITGQYLDSMSASFYGLTTGMYVASVTSDQATAAGLQKGDIITAIDGTKVTSSTTITSVVTKKKPGDTVELTVDRALEGKSSITITVTLSEYKQTTSSTDDSSSSSGQQSGNQQGGFSGRGSNG